MVRILANIYELKLRVTIDVIHVEAAFQPRLKVTRLEQLHVAGKPPSRDNDVRLMTLNWNL